MEILELTLVAGILICVAALIVLSVKRRSLKKKDAPPAAVPETITEMRDPEKTQPVKQEPEIPAVTLFEDRLHRSVRRCPHCDGENPPETAVCGICGRKL